ncbi:hypothetical protein [Caldalkalibacillus salinus]|uniref:hypothetical protein n=1 Tax=Caldalkalibacillus salinus TaxID=2803787 RepID=UPI001923AEFC|nr:hypothetical protein [Caldalkalibacillus salinus]
MSVTNLQTEWIVQLCMLTLLLVIITSMKIDAAYRDRVNQVMLAVLVIFSFIALMLVPRHMLLYALLLVVVLLGLLTYFLHQVGEQHVLIDHPVAYLAFYFPVIILVMISGQATSPLFPEAFVLPVIYITIHVGRRISYGVVMISTVTVLLLLLHRDVGDVVMRAVVTVAVMIMLPQLYYIVYQRNKAKAKEQWRGGEGWEQQ